MHEPGQRSIKCLRPLTLNPEIILREVNAPSRHGPQTRSPEIQLSFFPEPGYNNYDMSLLHSTSCKFHE